MSKTGKRVRTGKRECEKGIAAGQPEAAARRVERGGLKNHRHSEKRAGRKKGGEKKKKGKGGGQLKGSEVEDVEEKKQILTGWEVISPWTMGRKQGMRRDE